MQTIQKTTLMLKGKESENMDKFLKDTSMMLKTKEVKTWPMKNKFSKDSFFKKVSQMATLADPAVIFSKSVHYTLKFIR